MLADAFVRKNYNPHTKCGKDENRPGEQGQRINIQQSNRMKQKDELKRV